MQPSWMREAEEWLYRAERDLLVARQSLEGSVTIPEAAAYHAQQAMEKALKGFLASRGQPIEKTHNLILILTDCISVDSDFGRFAGTARTLSPYAFLFRYPGGPREPSVTQAEDALQLAGEVVEYVQDQLTPSPSGSST